jgi:hypothetical protein
MALRKEVGAMTCKPFFTSQARILPQRIPRRTISSVRILYPTGVGLMRGAPLSLGHPPPCRNCAPGFVCMQAYSMVTYNPCERFLGSIRRKCLDHLLRLHEKQLILCATGVYCLLQSSTTPSRVPPADPWAANCSTGSRCQKEVHPSRARLGRLAP